MLMRRLVLAFCVLVALACKIGEIATDSGFLAILATPSLNIQGDVNAEPAIGRRNSLIPVTFTGSFPLDTWVVAGSGITVSAVNQPNAKQIQAAVTIEKNAPFGPQLLSLTNSQGQQLTARFVILPEDVPTISSVTPNRLERGTATTVTVKGAHFTPLLSFVDIAADGQINPGLATVVDSETLTVRLTVASNAVLARRFLTVVNAIDVSDPYPIDVVDPPPPAFVLTSVSPSAIAPGRTTTLTLTGSNFQPNAAVVVDPPAGIQVTVTSVTATSAVANFVVSSTATPGTRNVRIGRTNEDISNAIPIQITQPVEASIAFNAAPVIISRGRSSILKWSVETTPATLSVQCALLIGTAKVADVSCRSGEYTVSPSTTTEYKFTVAGPGLSDWAYATVVVEDPGPTTTPSANSRTFTSGANTFTIPAGVSQLTVEVSGAAGGAGGGSCPSCAAGAAGGLGGRVTATIAVTAGETLFVNVGFAGANGTWSAAGGGGGGSGGFGGDGGFASNAVGGGGGGGASSVKRGSTDLVMAGGGGGGGGNFGGTVGGAGGAGGGAGAAAAGGTATSTGGGGGTQTTGGAPGLGSANDGIVGSAFSGGDGGDPSTVISAVGGGGGGGSGIFGGGGGGGAAQAAAAPGGGGGGGASLTAAGATSVTHAQGVQSGAGLVVIRW